MFDDVFCLNCNHFISDPKDYESGFGICFNNCDDFDDHIDEIMENGEFSCCMDLYDKKRFDGYNHQCEGFEMVEIFELDIYKDKERELDNQNRPELNESAVRILLEESFREQISHKDFFNVFKTGNDKEVSNALSVLTFLLAVNDDLAKEKLISYFKKTGPADNLKDVRRRVLVIEALAYIRDEGILTSLFIDELYKTPSNNTTRQIYNAIFRYFQDCELENIAKPLLKYIKTSGCSYRIKKRILGLLEEIAMHQD